MEDGDLEAELTEHMKELAKAKRLVVEAEVREKPSLITTFCSPAVRNSGTPTDHPACLHL